MTKSWSDFSFLVSTTDRKSPYFNPVKPGAGIGSPTSHQVRTANFIHFAEIDVINGDGLGFFNGFNVK